MSRPIENKKVNRQEQKKKKAGVSSKDGNKRRDVERDFDNGILSSTLEESAITS
jgi:hypothetical protein